MNPKTAIKIMLWLLLGVMLFHVSIVLKIVPYAITWGGRLKNDTEMYVFETISIVINLFLVSVLLMKSEYLKGFFAPKIINGILWVFFVLFALNTIGNVLAATAFEKFFALLTFISAVLIWNIIAKSEKNT